MTIEEKMDHFRRLSLESANSQSEQSLSSYKQTMDEELELHMESSTQLAEESKKAQLNQVRATLKKDLASAQMMIRKDLTQTQSGMKAKLFERVREKLAAYRKTPEYVSYLTSQIKELMTEYKNYEITVYIDSEDSPLLENLRNTTGAHIEIYDKDFLGGTRTIVPEKNILVDNSFKTRLADEQEQFSMTN